MNKIIRKEQFSENVFLFEIEAPLIARSRKAGNFIIVRVGEKGERVPLTIADADTDKGTITIVVQRVGLSSVKLSRRSRRPATGCCRCWPDAPKTSSYSRMR